MNKWPSTHRRDTDKVGVTHTVRISCDCRTCKGRVAWTRESTLEKGATQHGLVSLAYSPQGNWQRAVLRDEV